MKLLQAKKYRSFVDLNRSKHSEEATVKDAEKVKVHLVLFSNFSNYFGCKEQFFWRQPKRFISLFNGFSPKKINLETEECIFKK